MSVNIAIVLSAEWANDERFMDAVKDSGHKDFLITYFALDTERKQRAAVGFAGTYICHPYSDRPGKDKSDRPSTKRRRLRDV